MESLFVCLSQHEVLAASEKVILRLNDLVSWITDQVDWMTGLKTQTIVQANSDTRLQPITASDRYELCRSLNQSVHPLAINSGLDFSDVIREKQVNGDHSSGSSVVVLSYPRYCRYRALLRRIEGREAEWMNNAAIQMAINVLGIPSTANKISVLFCRDTFEHEALLQNDLNCEHLAPKLKGRPRKRNNMRGAHAVNNCQRSSSPESNTSDESKNSQIRTTRRSALNKNNSTEKSVPRRNNVVKSANNKINNSNNNNNNDNDSADETDILAINGTKLKELCIQSEQTFLKHLNKFMKNRKTPIQRVPHLGFKQIDLFFFFTHAQELGGYEQITCNKLWKKLYDAMGGDPGSTSAATCTRRHYERLLLPFERHLNGEQEKKKGRKTKDPTPKKGKKGQNSQKNNDNTGANNGLKCKKKVTKAVNGVKSKIKCNDGQYSDDTSVGADKPIESQPEVEEEPKQPKLIVKFNLLKVKNSNQEVNDECSQAMDVKLELTSAKEELDQSCEIKDVKAVKKLEVQPVMDFSSDTEDDNDKKQLFDLKREDMTEDEEDVDIEKTVAKRLTRELNIEAKVEPKLVTESASEDQKTSANSDSVIHLSPVSDICEDEEPISDIKVESMANSSLKVDAHIAPVIKANGKHSLNPDIKSNKSILMSNPLKNLSTVQPVVGATPSAAPLPFPVAASPLFSISTLVNSVPPAKPEALTSMTSPPPTAHPISHPALTPTTPQLAAASLVGQHHYNPTIPTPMNSVPVRPTAAKPLPTTSPQHMKSVQHIGLYRPSVIKTTNPMASTQYQPKPQLNYKTKPSAVQLSAPLPAHLNPFMAIEKKVKTNDIICNDVLDLSVKKRCLEADSRTSPSQALIDGSNGLDLSVKKRKVESPKQDVPKAIAAITAITPTTAKPDQRLGLSGAPLRAVTPLAPPTTPHKLSPPLQSPRQHSPVISVVPQTAKVSPPQSLQYPKSVSQIELQKFVNNKALPPQPQPQPQPKLPTQLQSAYKSGQQSGHQSSHRVDHPVVESPHLQSLPSSRHSPHQSPQRPPQQVSHPKQREQLSDRHLVSPRVVTPTKQSVRPVTITPTHQLSANQSLRDSQSQKQHSVSHVNSSKSSTHPSSGRESRQQQSPVYRSDDKLSSKAVASPIVSSASVSSVPSHRTLAPTISDYNPSLPTFNPGLYSTPNLWWPNGLPATAGLVPSVSSASPMFTAASAAAMAPISPHLLASHPLLSGAYPQTTAEHLLAQLDSSAKAANYMAYKQLLDQHHSQQTHNPYQLFQHLNNFYATK